MSADEMERLCLELRRYSEDEKVENSRIVARNCFENYIHQIRDSIKDERLVSKMTTNDEKKVSEAILGAQKWLESNQRAEKEYYELEQRQFEAVVRPIFEKYSTINSPPRPFGSAFPSPFPTKEPDSNPPVPPSKEEEEVESESDKGPETGSSFDVFLTHDWGMDEKGRNNHERVSRVNKALQKRGIKTWFDEEKMEGIIRHKMARAITQSKIILVFVTQRYCEKIETGNSLDNCFYEFNYTTITRPSEHIEVAVMEERMRNSSNWGIRLRAELGSLLYTDMVDDELKVFERQCDQLAERIRMKLKITKAEPEESKKPGNTGTSSDSGANSKNNEVDYEAAWALLQPEKASNPEVLRTILEEDGLTSPLELKYAEKEDLLKLAEQLKKFPRKQFLSMFHLN
jgi:hypothetical protein